MGFACKMKNYYNVVGKQNFVRVRFTVFKRNDDILGEYSPEY
jgi:hypothetical protein